MGTKCTFLCGLHNIEVNEDLGDGFILVPNEKSNNFPSIKITNNKSKLSSLLNRELAVLIGAIEYSHLTEGYPIVAFAENEFESDKVSSIDHLDLHLYLLKAFFFCLWMTKDNAADFDIGFLQFTNSAGMQEVSANNMTTTNFDVSGNRASNQFTIKELNTASKYLKECIHIQHNNRPKLASASSLDRIGIANYFIQSATISYDLGIKAVGYCSALETLFANGDNTELSHKLSERVSKFLEKELEPRKTIYKNVKKIYDIRSKVVHGATYKSNKVEELSESVKQADEICRRIMIYALTTNEVDNIFDKSREDLETYFLDLILR
ncbi:hypothetical protein FC093_20130 [Ilyomonas limi]|uniref:Uncharacterized protein n=1 Tax=Ilyomonas limi TaxID=2575867 RepID=A0A4U3KSX8_9BACT|nr:HEPN domain-containing protein [Ilyomonas limi]TKK65421.1 hypothetical protein FC093_20130 [Ilyomonas limi]